MQLPKIFFLVVLLLFSATSFAQSLNRSNKNLSERQWDTIPKTLKNKAGKIVSEYLAKTQFEFNISSGAYIPLNYTERLVWLDTIVNFYNLKPDCFEREKVGFTISANLTAQFKLTPILRLNAGIGYQAFSNKMVSDLIDCPECRVPDTTFLIYRPWDTIPPPPSPVPGGWLPNPYPYETASESRFAKRIYNSHFIGIHLGLDCQIIPKFNFGANYFFQLLCFNQTIVYDVQNIRQYQVSEFFFPYKFSFNQTISANVYLGYTFWEKNKSRLRVNAELNLLASKPYALYKVYLSPKIGLTLNFGQ